MGGGQGRRPREPAAREGAGLSSRGSGRVEGEGGKRLSYRSRSHWLDGLRAGSLQSLWAPSSRTEPTSCGDIEGCEFRGKGDPSGLLGFPANHDPLEKRLLLDWVCR